MLELNKSNEMIEETDLTFEQEIKEYVLKMLAS